MNNLFNGLNNNNQQNNFQMNSLSMIEQARRNGKITDEQYNTIMQNQNDPQKICSVLLQMGLANNNQIAHARNDASNLFGIKY